MIFAEKMLKLGFPSNDSNSEDQHEMVFELKRLFSTHRKRPLLLSSAVVRKLIITTKMPLIGFNGSMIPSVWF